MSNEFLNFNFVNGILWDTTVVNEAYEDLILNT